MCGPLTLHWYTCTWLLANKQAGRGYDGMTVVLCRRCETQLVLLAVQIVKSGKKAKKSRNETKQ